MSKPESLQTVTVRAPKTDALTGWMKRHEAALRNGFTKGMSLPETTVQACPRRKVADFPEGFIPARYYERNLEQNQQIAHCCRHPENHEVEALKSHPDEKVPDIYVFHCTCGRKHRRMFVGLYDREGESRPMWQ